jgi:hypothetical protein
MKRMVCASVQHLISGLALLCAHNNNNNKTSPQNGTLCAALISLFHGAREFCEMTIKSPDKHHPLRG